MINKEEMPFTFSEEGSIQSLLSTTNSATVPEITRFHNVPSGVRPTIDGSTTTQLSNAAFIINVPAIVIGIFILLIILIWFEVLRAFYDETFPIKSVIVKKSNVDANGNIIDAAINANDNVNTVNTANIAMDAKGKPKITPDRLKVNDYTMINVEGNDIDGTPLTITETKVDENLTATGVNDVVIVREQYAVSKRRFFYAIMVTCLCTILIACVVKYRKRLLINPK